MDQKHVIVLICLVAACNIRQVACCEGLQQEMDGWIRDVVMPEMEQEKQTVRVEARVFERMYELEIQYVYATADRLIVVSELNPIDAPLDDEYVRIYDQIVIDVPEDLVVDHYIIGEKPDGVFDEDYKFVRSASMVDVSAATLLYEK